jgi:hypothetical protein
MPCSLRDASSTPDGSIVNGPYVEAKEMTGGYSVVEADHYEQAL